MVLPMEFSISLSLSVDRKEIVLCWRGSGFFVVVILVNR